MAESAWKMSIDEGVAWLLFDRPGAKVNTFDGRVLRDLDDLYSAAIADPAVRAVVIASGKEGSFIAGADIDELARIADADDAREKSEAGTWVFSRLGGGAIPTIAVIHGSCLGGGLEMALACDYRLVTDHDDTRLGLPEVGLGIIPGWGGTQRLPRLIGVARALPMILTGKPVSGRKAMRLGLADGIVAPGLLRDQAQRFILDRILTDDGPAAVQRRRRRCRPLALRLLEATPIGRQLICRRAMREVRRRTHGNYPAPLEALRVVRRTAGARSLAEGLRLEREAFSRLACTSASRNLLWLYQAGRRARKGGGGNGRGVPEVRSVAVVGGGIMGSGIAWTLSCAGIPVRLKEIDWPAATRAMSLAADHARQAVKRRKMTEGQAALAMHRISPAIDYHGFERADLVIEAVVEKMAVKQAVLREIEAAARPDAIICTNTSSLPLRELAACLDDPRRFAGLHFFNPVPRMPLVEVVAAPRTLKRTMVAAAELVRRMGKTPLVVGDCPGFLVNRILLPYLVESAWMFEQGADPRRIDRLLERFGMPMGPLALVDEVGLDVGYEVARVLESAYGERMAVPRSLGDVAAVDDLRGRKSGRGFYVYENGHRRINRQVIELAEAARRRDGVEVRELSDEEIVDRAVLIMVNEAARCLEEGVVPDAESLDLAMVMGTGFAPFRGGLLHYADERGVDGVRQRLEELAARCGERFRPAPLLEKICGNGGRFYHANGA